MIEGRMISNISIQLIDGQNIQQSKLSVLLKMMMFGHGGSLDLLYLGTLFLIMWLLAQFFAPSLRRGGEGLELWLAPGWVLRSCVNLYTDINCL